MEVEFYNKRVEKDFRKLPAGMRNDIANIIILMKKRNTWNLGMPHIRHISGTPLYEIRLHDKNGIARMMFVSSEERKLTLLHVFVKKTQTTPKKETDLAMKRLKEFKNG